MALTNPPWLNYSPLDVIGMGVKGAQLGIERGGQATQALTAANQLGLGYAQLASENQRSAAANSLESQRIQAANALRMTELDRMMQYHGAQMEARNRAIDALNDYRGGVLESRALRDSMAAAKSAQGKPEPKVKEYVSANGTVIPYMVDFATGRGSWAPAGSFGGKGGSDITQRDKLYVNQLVSERNSLLKKYADPKSAALPAYGEDQKRLKAINDELHGILRPGPPATHMPVMGGARMADEAGMPSGGAAAALIPAGGGPAIQVDPSLRFQGSGAMDPDDPLGLFPKEPAGSEEQ